MSNRKPWLFLSTALLGLSLTACGGDSGERPEQPGTQAPGSVDSDQAENGEGVSDGDTADAGQDAGDGAEPGAPPEPQLSDGAARVFVLGQISGHLSAARELHETGDLEHAQRHFAHPVGEVIAGNPGVFVEAEQADLAAAVEAVATVAAINGDSDEEFDAVYDAAQAQIAAGMAKESLADHASGLSALMDQARDEFDTGVTDGAVSDAIEYQDTWGFAVALRAAFNDRRAEYDAASEAQAGELDMAIRALQDLRRSVNADPPAPTSAIRSAITRVQIALTPFQAA